MLRGAPPPDEPQLSYLGSPTGQYVGSPRPSSSPLPKHLTQSGLVLVSGGVTGVSIRSTP